MSASIKDFTPSGLSKLKPKVKRAWLKVLRSGNRKQVEGALKGRNHAGQLGYCCLGILCDLGKDRKEKWEPASWVAGDEMWTYDGSDGFPPGYVLDRAGLHEQDANTLAEMNDAGIGCKRIARWIEKHL